MIFICELFSELESLHGYTLKHITDELYWPGSMPSILPSEDQIPLAYYGESNVGKLKTLYRKGLSNRYGSSMQTIAGVHYNFSFSDIFWKELKQKQNSDLDLKEFKNTQYFKMIRNFKRHSWFLMYLFGASPAVHSSFLEGKKHKLQKLSDNTYYTPEGISLRMGGLGYTSSAQTSMTICFDQVETYIKTIEQARLESYPEYEAIGLIQNGEYQQLNTNLIQIDNEFYSTIRPKNVASSRESALKALHLRGVEYIEVRLLDNDPFTPLGTSSEQVDFMHLFLSWCLADDSPLLTDKENTEIDENFMRVVTKGRRKDLDILNQGIIVPLKDRVSEVFEQIEKSMSAILKKPEYAKAFKTQFDKTQATGMIPAERVMSELSKYDNDYVKFNMNQAQAFRDSFKVDPEFGDILDSVAQKAFTDKVEIEQNDKLQFDDFLKKYFSDIKIEY